MLTDQQSIEIFHLAFLRVLKNLLDADLYAIKGGCNLRFFFGSIRYSEDIDFDISVISEHTLKKKIDSILSGVPLAHGLATYKLSIDSFSAPKQSATVQRWKVGIKHADKLRTIPTKIEFSRRTLGKERKSEQVQDLIFQEYRLPPMILPHYLYIAACEQKISALINRTETQARDIFDLNLLFSKKEFQQLQLSFDLQKASDCVLSITFNDYRSQVVSYLLKEYIEYYESPAVWEEIQFSVIERLGKIHHEAN